MFLSPIKCEKIDIFCISIFFLFIIFVPFTIFFLCFLFQPAKIDNRNIAISLMRHTLYALNWQTHTGWWWDINSIDNCNFRDGKKFNFIFLRIHLFFFERNVCAIVIYNKGWDTLLKRGYLTKNANFYKNPNFYNKNVEV